MFCAIWYHLYNLRSVTFSKVAGFSEFANGLKSRNAPHIKQCVWTYPIHDFLDIGKALTHFLVAGILV